jgi:hypothetical protein
MKSKKVDLLTIAHFIQWFIIGIIFPKRYVLAFILGIIWELFEIFIVENKTMYNFVKNNWFISENYWNETMTNKGIDIVTNMLGYIIGSNIIGK